MNWLTTLLAALGAGIVAIAVFAVVSIVAAIPTYFLWNWLMPTILGVNTITFWQAWGINFLSAILFKTSVSSSK